MSSSINTLTGSSAPTSYADLNNPLMREIVENVRFFMRDYAELNRLTKGKDHSDRHVMWAVLDTLSDWSSTPPFLGYGLQSIFQMGWQGLFVRGVAISLLESLHFLHLRNFVSYSDGGVNIQVENPQLIQAAMQLLKNDYEQKKQRVLIASNIERAFQSGVGVSSEYLFINSFWGSL
jgi:hypothetical protein